MIEGAQEFSRLARQANALYPKGSSFRVACLSSSATRLHRERLIKRSPTPKVVITSPPYPGVHVLYHRWQVHGRKETPAPFWIANCFDGNGAAFYTFGDRKQKHLDGYYRGIRDSFASISRIVDRSTLVVQMVAFSKPAWQLPRYLDVITSAGFHEMKVPGITDSPDGRVRRKVPNRKWYASQRDELSSSNEVVLFHRLS